MFLTPDVPFLLTGVKLKIEKTDTGEKPVAHATFTLEPFLPQLAHELGEDIHDHLFEADLENPELPRPRPEIADVGFNLRLGLQTLISKPHAELKADAAVQHVRVTKVRVTRPDPGKPRLALSWVAELPLDERQTIDWLVRSFARQVCLTFNAEQLDMLDGNAATDAADRLVLAGLSAVTGPDGVRHDISLERVDLARKRAQRRREREN